MEGPDATVHGTLTIGDPDTVAALLARGLGRHRAYGYGILMHSSATVPISSSRRCGFA